MKMQNVSIMKSWLRYIFEKFPCISFAPEISLICCKLGNSQFFHIMNRSLLNFTHFITQSKLFEKTIFLICEEIHF